MTGTDIEPVQPRYPARTSGAELFPEDQYEHLPGLSDDAKHNIAGGHQPFMVTAVMLRHSDKYGEEKPFWFAVINLEGHEFTTNFSAFIERYDPEGGEVFASWDRWSRIANALNHGAQAVGPLTLEEIDTGKGNPFFKVKAHLPQTKVTQRKSA